MKPFILLLVASAFACSPLLAADDTIRVKLTVQVADEGLQNKLVSKISREIRKSPDVEIVYSGETYGVSLVCVRNKAALGLLACAVNYLYREEIAFWKDSLKPGNPALFDSLADSVKAWDVVASQTVMTIGVDNLDELASDIGDTLNAKYFEVFRSTRSMVNRITK